jgi:hypothetical protein
MVRDSGLDFGREGLVDDSNIEKRGHERCRGHYTKEHVEAHGVEHFKVFGFVQLVCRALVYQFVTTNAILRNDSFKELKRKFEKVKEKLSARAEATENTTITVARILRKFMHPPSTSNCAY